MLNLNAGAEAPRQEPEIPQILLPQAANGFGEAHQEDLPLRVIPRRNLSPNTRFAIAITFVMGTSTLGELSKILVQEKMISETFGNGGLIIVGAICFATFAVLMLEYLDVIQEAGDIDFLLEFTPHDLPSLG